MAIITVTTLVDSTAVDGQVSLREALQAANTDTSVDGSDAGSGADEIVFTGLSGPISLSPAGELTISSDVTIVGDSDLDGTTDITIDAHDASRIFQVTAGTSTLDHLVMTRGQQAGEGGGIRINSGAALTLANSTVSDSDAVGLVSPPGRGGGIWSAGALQLVDSTVSGNTSDLEGGGIYLGGGGSLVARNATISNNYADGSGGGLAVTGSSSATMIDTTVSGNGSGFGGGGIGQFGAGSLTLTNSTLSDNFSGFSGGGLLSENATLTNVTVWGNEALTGGGIGNRGALVLTSSTVTGNYATTLGGGLYNYAPATLTNSIVAGNDAVLAEDDFHDAGTSTQTNTLIGGTLANIFATLTTIDPGTPGGPTFQAGALADNGGPVQTVAIKLGGDADGTGSNAALPQDPQDLDHDGITSETLPVDARGGQRVVGASVDVGAFEAGQFIVTTLDDETAATSDFATELADGNGLSLREALALANAVAGADRITFLDSLAGGAMVIDSALGELVISSDVTIVGDTDGDHRADIAVDGDDQVRVFNVSGGTSTLESLTIVGGNAGGGPGGGVYVGGGALTIANTTIFGNSASSGGGIYNSSTLTLLNSTLAGNSSVPGDGGGLFNNGTAVLTNVTLANNTAELGGGMANADTATLTNTTVSGNTASDGGGIFNAGNLTLANSIVLGHVVPGNYAEIFQSAGTLSYAGVNIVGLGFDTNPGDGVINAQSSAAVFAHVGVNGEGLLADNGGPVPTIALNPDAANPAFDIGSATRLDEAAVGLDLNGDGDQADTIATDARGFARPAGAGVDLGALEQQAGVSFVVTTLNDELDSTAPNATITDMGGLGDLSLREALFLAQQDPTSVDDITFDPALTGGVTPLVDNGEIVLTQGELLVIGSANIDGDVNGDDAFDITLRADPGNPSPVLHFYQGISSLNGVRVTGGAAYYGAGVSVGAYLYGGIATVTISNAQIDHNVADIGGGISVDTGSSLRLVNSTVSDNAADIGGGIAVALDGRLTVINSTISGNEADPNLGLSGYGGGIAIYAEAEVTLINTTVSGNTGYTGGGLYNAGFLTLINTTLANNVAEYGGGLYNTVPLCGCGGNAALINSTVSGNYAYAAGGGIYHYAGILTITNSIVAGNATGGSYADLALYTGTTTNFFGHNVVSQAGIVDPAVIFEPNLANIFASVVSFDPDGALGPIGAFDTGELANNGGPVQTVVILQGPQGVAHDAGDNAQLPQDTQDLDGDNNVLEPLPFDARGLGFNRVANGTVDIGAFEIQNSAPTQNFNTGLNLDEGNSATILGTQLDFNDAEQGDADITYTVTTATANGTLFLNNNPLLANDTFTQADITGGALTYTHDGSETTTDSFAFDVSDGVGGTVTGQSFAFTINPVNDQAGGAAGGTIQYIEDQAPTALDPSLTVTDPDDTHLEGAQVAITSNFAAGQDVLGFTSQFGITGSYNAGTGVLTLNGHALLADYQTVLRSVTYFNTSQNPSDAQRTVSFQVDDGDGLAGMGTVGVNVIPVLDPPNDANGDHTTDILWRNDEGTVDLWTMDGVGVIANQAVATLPTRWHIVDADSDFDGDGRSDILWRDDAGTVVLWTMDGAIILSNTSLGTLPDYWRIADTADFTGDGRADILWRDDAGRVVLWEMNGATIVHNTFVADVATTSHIADAADYTGDGMADILWRDDAGTLRLWEMNGANVVNDTTIATVPATLAFQGSGDFNHDDRFDILWRDGAGTMRLWEMDGANILADTALGTLPDYWFVADLGDYTGDLNSDILWRDDAGTIVLWEMNGHTIVDNTAVNTIGTQWHVVA